MTAGARHWLLALACTLPLALAGCADSPPPQPFTPLTYGYLRPLRLAVGSIDIQNDSTPGPEDVSAQSPAIPADVLAQMAHTRLVPAGSAGRALFTIEQASIVDNGDMLSATMRVRLDIYTSDNQPTAYAEAAVVRTAEAPNDDDKLPAALYDLTSHMMDDMNVELEYQLRRTLGDWLQTGPATAPPPVAVQQEALPPPGATSLAPAASPAPGTTSPAPPGSPLGFRFVPVEPTAPASPAPASPANGP